MRPRIALSCALRSASNALRTSGRARVIQVIPRWSTSSRTTSVTVGTIARTDAARVLAGGSGALGLGRRVRRAAVLLELHVRVPVDAHFVLRAERARCEQGGHRCLIGNGEAFVASTESAGK